ncbi:MAG: helix-turn-helix transcriptional regulator [Rhodoferax sp.]|nr:helix-turn-helix transcriptional regulator [Rhodoferax sp.]
MKRKTTTDPLIAEIKAGMARKGFTQEDIAKTLHTSRAAVSRRMAGEVAFSYIEIRAISKFLEVPVAVLYGDKVAA